MALETFNYLDSLVATNPTVSDGVVNGDDHIRGIKSTLLSTFPNLTGAVTGTQTQLNVVAAWATDGANKLDDTAYNATYTSNGLSFPDVHTVDVVIGGAVKARFTDNAGHTLTGKLTVTDTISGPGITPIGAAVMWFDDTLPSDGLWAWANGQIIANANTVAPVLLARWGSRYGGNGVTTMGVPNLQEVVPIGKSGMGGATSPGLLTSIALGVKNVIDSIFGADTTTLAAANIPSLTSTNASQSITVNAAGTDKILAHNDAGVTTVPANIAGGGGMGLPYINAITQIWKSITSLTSNNSISVAYTNASPTAISRVQPSRVVNWIIRIG